MGDTSGTPDENVPREINHCSNARWNTGNISKKCGHNGKIRQNANCVKQDVRL